MDKHKIYKEETVNIIQISACYSGDDDTIVYGLGDDQRIYWWNNCDKLWVYSVETTID